MRKINLRLRCSTMALVTVFIFLFHPVGSNRFSQSVVWAGNAGWSDAFGNNSQGGSSSERPRPGASADNWNNNSDRNRPSGSLEPPAPQREDYERESSDPQENPAAQSQTLQETAEKAVRQNSTAEAKTAEELLILFNLPVVITNTSEESIEVLIKNSPDAAAYADIFREFGKRYLTWENLKEPIIKRYTETFSSRDLQQLKTFFSSDVGKKYVQKSGQLMQETTRDLEKTILSFQEELKRMIVARELEKFSKQ